MIRRIYIMAKKILALVLALMFVCSMAFAELPTWYQSIADKTDDNLVDMDETLEITWWGFNYEGELPINDSYMQQVIEKRFNVKINNVLVDNYVKEQFNIMLASGADYDIMTTAQSFSTMAEQGTIRSIDKAMVEEYAPTIVSLLEEAAGDSWASYATVDGKLYGIPQVTASWDTPIVMGIRTDWLNNIGYDADNLPTTIDELEEMLLKFVTDDPDGDGEDNTYALGMSNGYGYYAFASYGVSRGYWYNNDDGELTHYAVDPNYKEALKLMQRWYELGIFDPEIITDARIDGVTKFAEGKLAGYEALDNCFGRNSGANLSGVRAAMELGNTDIDMTFIPPVVGESGEAKTQLYSATLSASGITFGKNCSDEKLIRLLQIEDSFFADLDLWLADQYGERYVEWDFDENGNVLAGVDKGFAEREGQTKTGMQRFYNFSFIPSIVLNWRLGGVGEYGSRYEVYKAVHDFPTIEPAAVTVFKTDAENQYGAACDKIVSEYFLKCFTGEYDVDETWDEYVASWLAAGGQEILDAKAEFAETLK